MILLDVNVLIYALRPESPYHRRCLDWLDGVRRGPDRFGMSPLALAAVVRVTSSPKVFRAPSRLEDAFRFADGMMAHPLCVVIEPGPRHWSIFHRLCTDTNTLGPRTTDAWFAALAIEHDCDFVTFDRDFGRFPGLTCRQPG